MTRLANAIRICDPSNGFKITTLKNTSDQNTFILVPCRGICNSCWIQGKAYKSNLQYVNKGQKISNASQSTDVELYKTNVLWLELPTDLAVRLIITARLNSQ